MSRQQVDQIAGAVVAFGACSVVAQIFAAASPHDKEDMCGVTGGPLAAVAMAPAIPYYG